MKLTHVYCTKLQNIDKRKETEKDNKTFLCSRTLGICLFVLLFFHLMFLCQWLCSLLWGFLFHEYGIFPTFSLYAYYYLFLFILLFFPPKMNSFRLSFQVCIGFLHVLLAVHYLYYFFKIFLTMLSYESIHFQSFSPFQKFKVLSNALESNNFLVVLPTTLFHHSVSTLIPQIFSLL